MMTETLSTTRADPANGSVSMATGELDTELQFHVDTRTADLIAAGLPTEEMQRQARLESQGLRMSPGQRAQIRPSTFAAQGYC
jgi:hypothetical protein